VSFHCSKTFSRSRPAIGLETLQLILLFKQHRNTATVALSPIKQSINQLEDLPAMPRTPFLSSSLVLLCSCDAFVVRPTVAMTKQPLTPLYMGLFDGVKDAFSAPALERSVLDAERETPIDRWMGWSVASENNRESKGEALGRYHIWPCLQTASAMNCVVLYERALTLARSQQRTSWIQWTNQTT
jgi:hypothetical protein